MGDIELKGNIVLSGFGELDRAEMSIVKKVIGSYARKFTDTFGITELKMVLKPVHKIENSEKYELKAYAIRDGKPVSSELVDKNLFFAMDSVLKKVEAQLD